jgi:antitoxin (DNA-binding transcriptional repressor) of toxin-antitoxin stability system
VRFVSVREFRSNAATIRRDLETDREIVLTSNGQPFAMLTPVKPDTLEDEAAAIRSARARLAIDRIREHARKAGLDSMSMGDVDTLIAETRRARQAGE